ncbi:MAG: hypothetical protein WA705_05145 [Candidatus Ozemobacteraceae bacterium]
MDYINARIIQDPQADYLYKHNHLDPHVTVPFSDAIKNSITLEDVIKGFRNYRDELNEQNASDDSDDLIRIPNYSDADLTAEFAEYTKIVVEPESGVRRLAYFGLRGVA